MVNEIFNGEIGSVEVNEEGNFEVFKEKSDKKTRIWWTTNMQGHGLKILTPDQMLRRLPITLAQLKAGNISQKPINEIRQLLHSLYRSKKLTKTIYSHLINAI